MASIDNGRVVVGGLAAGLIMNVVDGVTNGVLIADKWKAQTDMLSPTLMARTATSSMIGWIVLDFVIGVLIVWLYAAIRPRYGAGPGTAVRAGFMGWLMTHAVFASYVFNGFYSWKLCAAASGAALIGCLAGAYAGGALYKEE
jgi:hypothetical protein